MSWIDSVLNLTAKTLRFKGVGIRSQSSPVRILTTVPTQIDMFFHADVSSANYIVLAEMPNGSKETFQVNVIAGIDSTRQIPSANILVYGRVFNSVSLVSMTATVDGGKCIIYAAPTADATSAYPGVPIQVKIFPIYMETIYGD
jgi:hypothetical protein